MNTTDILNPILSAIGVTIGGILIVVAKDAVNKSVDMFNSFIDMKSKELEEKKKSNILATVLNTLKIDDKERADLNQAVGEGVSLAEQKAKIISKDPSTPNLTGQEMKQIALDHIEKAIGTIKDPDLVNDKIEATVNKLSPLSAILSSVESALPAIQPIINEAEKIMPNIPIPPTI